MPRENPHDKLFKQTFSIASEAKAFVKLHLPEWISTNLDYRFFKRSSESFVNDQLQEYFSDIIYTCRWKGGKEQLQLSFILEHKSYVPSNILLQLLRYILESYDHQHLQRKPFSLVVPVVIYHGKQKWVKRDFASYFKLPDERLKKYLPFFEYELIDLTRMTDELLKDVKMGAFLRSTFLLFKHKDDIEFVKRESKEIFIFVEQALSKDQKNFLIRMLLTYIFHAYKFDRAEFKAYTKTLPKMVEYVAGSIYDQIVKDFEVEKKKIEKQLVEQKKQAAAELAEQKKQAAAELQKAKAEQKRKAATELRKIKAAQKKASTINSLKRLLDFCLLLPTATLTDTAKLSGVKRNTVKLIKETLANDKFPIIKKNIEQLLFADMALTKAELKEIHTLIKKYLETRKKK